MPMYDGKCPNCSTMVKDIVKKIADPWPECPQCRTILIQVFGQPAEVILFKEGIYEHLTWEPQYVTSKRQLRELCDKYDCHMPYLM